MSCPEDREDRDEDHAFPPHTPRRGLWRESLPPFYGCIGKERRMSKRGCAGPPTKASRRAPTHAPAPALHRPPPSRGRGPGPPGCAWPTRRVVGQDVGDGSRRAGPPSWRRGPAGKLAARRWAPLVASSARARVPPPAVPPQRRRPSACRDGQRRSLARADSSVSRHAWTRGARPTVPSRRRRSSGPLSGLPRRASPARGLPL